MLPTVWIQRLDCNQIPTKRLHHSKAFSTSRFITINMLFWVQKIFTIRAWIVIDFWTSFVGDGSQFWLLSLLAVLMSGAIHCTSSNTDTESRNIKDLSTGLENIWGETICWQVRLCKNGIRQNYHSFLPLEEAFFCQQIPRAIATCSHVRNNTKPAPPANILICTSVFGINKTKLSHQHPKGPSWKQNNWNDRQTQACNRP